MADQETERRNVSDYLVLTQEYSDEPATQRWYICDDLEALNALMERVAQKHVVAIYRGTKLDFRVETTVRVDTVNVDQLGLPGLMKPESTVTAPAPRKRKGEES